jgi:hypothetical protein
MEQPVEAKSPSCANCGSPLADRFCRTIRALLQRLFGEITSLDGRFWRSIRVLLARPGKLTHEFVHGRRVSYLNPGRLFLVINVLYFFVQPFTGFGGYNTSLDSQLSRQVYSEWAQLSEAVRSEVKANLTATLMAEGTHPDSLSLSAYDARWNTESRQYRDRFNRRSATFAATLILLFIPAIALLLFLLYLRRPEFLTADHAIFATHFMAWELLAIGCLYLPFLALISLGAITVAGGAQEFTAFLSSYPGLEAGVEFVNEVSSLIIVFVYLFMAIRRFYRDSRWVSGLKAAVLTVASALLLPIYRFLLFWLTYWNL